MVHASHSQPPDPDTEHSGPSWRQRHSDPIRSAVQIHRRRRAAFRHLVSNNAPSLLTHCRIYETAPARSSGLLLRRNGQPRPFPPLPPSGLAARVCLPIQPTAMAKTKQGKRDVDAYTIKGTNKVVRGKRLPRPARALDRSTPPRARESCL